MFNNYWIPGVKVSFVDEMYFIHRKEFDSGESMVGEM